MKCSLCIPTFRRPENLNNLLSCVIGMDDDRIDEVLIGVSYGVEESFNKTTRHLLRALEISGIDYTVRTEIPGLMKAKQWFSHQARNDVLLVVDDDGVISRKYLDLLHHFEDDGVAAVSGSIQIPLDLGLYSQYSYDEIEAPEEGVLCNKVFVGKDGLVDVSNKYQLYLLDKSREYECEILIGTAMFIRRELLCADENFNRGGCHYEELDYTYSAFRKGKRLIFDSSRIGFHMHNDTGGMRAVIQQLKEVNSDYFKEKYGL